MTRVAARLGGRVAVLLLLLPSAAYAIPSVAGDSDVPNDFIVGANAGFTVFAIDIENPDTIAYNVASVQFTVFNEGGFIPATTGSTSTTGRGDIDEIAVYIGPTFATATTLLDTDNRGSSFMQFGSEQNSYPFTMPVDIPTSPSIPAAGGSTTRRTIKIVFKTWDVIGDAPDSLAGGVNWIAPGDRFRVRVDTITLRADTTVPGSDTDLDVASGRPSSSFDPVHILYLPPDVGVRLPNVGVCPPFHPILPPTFDVSNSSKNDAEDLDFIGWRPVFGFHLIGGPGNVQTLQEIVLNIIHPAGMDVRNQPSPLFSIDNSERSGLQIRRNSSPDGPDRGDVLVPIDLDYFQSSYQMGTTMDTVHLRLANPAPLSQATEKSANTICDAENANDPEYYVGVSASLEANLGDTLVFVLPNTGLRLNGVASRDTTLYGGRSNVLFGIPTVYEDFTTSNQFITQASPPTPLVGIDVWDTGRDFRLSQMWIYIADDSGTLTTGDFRSGSELVDGFSNDMEAGTAESIALSGFALYRDNDGNPQNTNGAFDAGIDTFIRFVNIGVQTRFFSPTGSEDLSLFESPQPVRVLVAKMEFDTTMPAANVPDTSGGASLGSDYFLVVRTSSSAAPGDRFRVWIGDLKPTDVLAQDFLFEGVIRSNPPGDDTSLVGMEGSLAYDNDSTPGPDTYIDWSVPDGMQTEGLTVNAVVATAYENLIPVVQDVFPGNRVAVFGINTVDSGGTFRINQVKVEVRDTATLLGDFRFDTDLAQFDASGLNVAGNPVALFQDNGTTNGVFDANDQPVGTTTVARSSASGVDTITFLIGGGFDIPDSDLSGSQGNDLFIVVNLSDSVTYLDDLTLRMPDSAITFTDPALDVPPAKTSGILRVGLPVRLNDLTVAGQTIDNVGSRVAVIGIDAADTSVLGAGNVLLDKVRVQVNNVSGFTILDLASLTADSASGIAVWFDSDVNGVFSDTADSFLALTGAPTIFGPNDFELDLVNVGAPVPDTPDGGRSDFFIVLRTNSSFVTVNDQFNVSIATTPPGGVTFTAPSDPTLTVQTKTITVSESGVSATVAPRTVIAPDFTVSSSNGYDTTTVTITIPANFPDTRWTFRIVSQLDSSVTSIPGQGSSAFVLGDTLGPTATAIYNLFLDYKNSSNSATTLPLGETLTVDRVGTTPETGPTAPTSPTTDTSVTLRVFADSAPANTDVAAVAGIAFESTATIEVYRNGALALTGRLVNFDTTLSLPLLSGSNVIEVVLVDVAGNRSNTAPYATVVRVLGAGNLAVDNLLAQISANDTIVNRGDTRVVFGINAVASLPATQIIRIDVEFFDTPSATPDTDFVLADDVAELTTGSSATSGILLWQDNGGVNGQFDTGDALVPIDPPIVTGNKVRIQPMSGGLSVPTDDTQTANQGYDFYIGVRMGASLRFLDDFGVRVPAQNGIFYNLDPLNGQSTTPNTPTSLPLVGNVVTGLADSTFSGETLSTIPLVVFGIDANAETQTGASTDSRPMHLTRVDIRLENVSNFNVTDLATLATDTSSGIAVYRDNGPHTGTFDSGDSLVTTLTAAVIGTSPDIVSLTFARDTTTVVPRYDTGVFTGPDFFVVFRASTTAQDTDQFRAHIDARSISYTDSEGLLTVRADTNVSSRTLTIFRGTSVSPLSPRAIRPDGDGLAETTSLRLTFGVSTSFRLEVRTYAGTTVVVRYDTNVTDTTIIFRPMDVADDSDLRREGQYHFVLITTSPSSNTTVLTSGGSTVLLSTDSTAHTIDTSTEVSTTQSGETLTIRVSLTLPDASCTSGVSPDTSTCTARSAGEALGNTIVIFNGTTALDSLVLSSASPNSGARSITLPQGVSLIYLQLTDGVGNVADSVFLGAFLNIPAEGLRVLFEGNSPVFYKNAAHPAFTFTFPGAVAGGAFLEVYNLAGNRLKRIEIPTGVFSIDWDGTNDEGRVLRNGVYLLRFNVPLTGGAGSVQERRTIVLMK